MRLVLPQHTVHHVRFARLSRRSAAHGFRAPSEFHFTERKRWYTRLEWIIKDRSKCILRRSTAGAQEATADTDAKEEGAGGFPLQRTWARVRQRR